MQGLAAGIGLYSIGVRGATIPELAVWAARCQIPFLHLRGGARGCAATRQTAQELDRWRAIADATAPVKLLTADLTLHDLIQPHEQRRRTAERELERTAETASRLGAEMIRVLAGPAPLGGELIPVPRLPETAMTLLIELHDASWWTPAATERLEDLTHADPRIRLLADTAQAAAGLAGLPEPAASVIAKHVLAMSAVVHLSDGGSGLTADGHALLAGQAQELLAAGQPLEVAFEWTGPQRTAPVCLSRYHAACAWWYSLSSGSEDEHPELTDGHPRALVRDNAGLPPMAHRRRIATVSATAPPAPGGHP
jgi:hypothetical protein